MWPQEGHIPQPTDSPNGSCSGTRPGVNLSSINTRAFPHGPAVQRIKKPLPVFIIQIWRLVQKNTERYISNGAFNSFPSLACPCLFSSPVLDFLSLWVSTAMEKEPHSPMEKSPNVENDTEAGGLSEGTRLVKEHRTALARKLKDRHITMISIGGVIGTGLFIGTASALQNGGPVGLLLGYLIVGSLCWSVMVSLGEMLAERFVSPALSFALGYNYWYYWTIGVPIEITASSILISYWDRDASLTPAWITMCMVVVIFINMLGAGIYGETEFIFASIKVITIIGLLILSLILMCGGGPDRDPIGFRYWRNPGPFVQFRDIPGSAGRFAGFWAVLSQAAFSFIGTEVVAMAAGEARNPRKTLPKAIKNVYIRILLFYIGGTFFIGVLVPSNDPGLNLADGTAASSPFTIAVERAGIKVLPSIINACILTSAWSSASGMLYSSSRALYALSLARNAPKIFSRTLKNGLPIVSLCFCSLFATIAYMSVDKGAGTVFGWLANLTAVAGLMSWLGISFTYTRFHAGLKAQGIDRKNLPYTSPLQPYLAYYAMAMCLILALGSGFRVFLSGGWAADTFVTNYLPLALFPVLYIVAWLIYRQPIVKLEDMDFTSGLESFQNDTPTSTPKSESA
ncbi:amino acid permease [Flagelloscypha sp. PMI_526]|nr:amino acid permease [Flagelloscypha sp. PMI_526]